MAAAARLHGIRWRTLRRRWKTSSVTYKGQSGGVMDQLTAVPMTVIVPHARDKIAHDPCARLGAGKPGSLAI